MENSNSWHGGASAVVPAGYDNPEQPKKNFKILIISGIVLLILIVVTVVAVLMLGNNSDSDYAGEEYDISSENTGGEDVVIPADESLDFLDKYPISDESKTSIMMAIYDNLDKFYSNSGYTVVHYDLDSVESSGSSISFNFTTDIEDVTFHALIGYDKDGNISYTYITYSETE